MKLTNLTYDELISLKCDIKRNIEDLKAQGCTTKSQQYKLTYVNSLIKKAFRKKYC